MTSQTRRGKTRETEQRAPKVSPTGGPVSPFDLVDFVTLAGTPEGLAVPVDGGANIYLSRPPAEEDRWRSYLQTVRRCEDPAWFAEHLKTAFEWIGRAGGPVLSLFPVALESTEVDADGNTVRVIRPRNTVSPGRWRLLLLAASDLLVELLDEAEDPLRVGRTARVADRLRLLLDVTELVEGFAILDAQVRWNRRVARCRGWASAKNEERQMEWRRLQKAAAQIRAEREARGAPVLSKLRLAREVQKRTGSDLFIDTIRRRI